MSKWNVKNICSHLQLKLIKDVVLGFIILAFFLYLVGHTYPPLYDWLTNWANQRKLPKIVSCRIVAVIPYSQMKILKPIKTFTFNLKLNSTPPTKELILYIKKEYRHGVAFEYLDAFQKKRLTTRLSSIIIDSKGSKLIDTNLVVDTDVFEIRKEELSSSQCPIDITFPDDRL